MAKGIFRPAIECRMKSNEAPGFCETCKAAINSMIDYYTK
jgi:IgA peptidase. Metallo peptidase. MEROPS family M64